ncbi:hypothetical protein Hanom_Chr09g00819681 [Helianthus anomalus]
MDELRLEESKLGKQLPNLSLFVFNTLPPFGATSSPRTRGLSFFEFTPLFTASPSSSLSES